MVSASDATLERSEERVNLWALPMEAGLLQRSRHPVQLTNGSLSYRNPVASHDGTQLFALGLAKRGELVRYDAAKWRAIIVANRSTAYRNLTASHRRVTAWRRKDHDRTDVEFRRLRPERALRH